ncbi:hypothetical protein BpHYR1_020090 [Brachionus plicatilis]|uniref:Uncharacterized protein n=1 Tax=Brachionus plicatilis TaxID=10195 RepID=A0A3M7Q1A4_BRAPC|nr:hypothetical protein BpHYR1_020090 [Brachionus plicatilis]
MFSEQIFDYLNLTVNVNKVESIVKVRKKVQKYLTNILRKQNLGDLQGYDCLKTFEIDAAHSKRTAE